MVLSGVTTVSFSFAISRADASSLRRRLGELLRVLPSFLDRADHVERLLGHVVALSLHDLLEAADCIGDLDEPPFEPRELRGNEEGLREEALDLAGPRHRQLVVFRELVDSEVRD